MVIVSLETMAGMCLGPCQKNKILLGSQFRLILLCNKLFGLKTNHKKLFDENTVIISATLKFLSSIVVHNENTQVLEKILEHLNVEIL